MKGQNKNTGKKGEELALAELLKRGYRLVESNFGNRFGEVDLVMRDGEVIVFVEVKTKVGDLFGAPEEMVDRRKLARVRRMGEVFVVERGVKDAACRIDVVAVVLSSSSKLERLTVYKNVL